MRQYSHTSNFLICTEIIFISKSYIQKFLEEFSNVKADANFIMNMKTIFNDFEYELQNPKNPVDSGEELEFVSFSRVVDTNEKMLYIYMISPEKHIYSMKPISFRQIQHDESMILSIFLYRIIVYTKDIPLLPNREITTEYLIQYLLNCKGMTINADKSKFVEMFVIPPSETSRCFFHVICHGSETDHSISLVNQTRIGCLTDDLSQSMSMLRTYYRMMAYFHIMISIIYSISMSSDIENSTELCVSESFNKLNPLIYKSIKNPQYIRRFNTDYVINIAQVLYNIRAMIGKTMLRIIDTQQTSIDDEVAKFYQQDIKQYVSDLGKSTQGIPQELKKLVQQARNKKVEQFLIDPTRSVKRQSERNKQYIKQKRKSYEKQLLAKYANQQTVIPKKLNNEYKKKINAYRKVLKEVHVLLEQFQGSIEDIVNEVIFEPLNMVDTINFKPIKNPVYFPDSPAIMYDLDSVQQYLKFNRDRNVVAVNPRTREQLHGQRPYNHANRDVIQKYNKVNQKVNKIISSQSTPVQKVEKILQLRQELQIPRQHV